MAEATGLHREFQASLPQEGKIEGMERGGSEVKSTSRGSEINSQHPLGGSQPFIMGSGALSGLQAYMQAELYAHNRNI